MLTRATTNCCAGFSRTQAARAAVAGGGAGSAREWDPRMPVPAGAGIDRRRFVVGALGGLLSVYGATRVGIGVPALAEGVAEAASLQGPTSPVLVSIFLAGGADALSVLAPAEDPLYRRLRPTLAVPADAGLTFREDPRLHWAPAAAAFARLHAAGKVTVLPGIGYTAPDMSHFTSRHFWEVGATDPRLSTGWLGRYLDAAGTAHNPLQGLSMDGAMNPTLATARNPVAAIETPDGFPLWLQNVSGDILEEAIATVTSLGDATRTSRDRALSQVAQAAAEVGFVRNALAPLAAGSVPAPPKPIRYPSAPGTNLPQRLAGLAEMLSAGLPLRCVALTTDAPFDTHADQAAAFDAPLKLVADAVEAFQADLEARGLADRVLVHVWSEFGRRAQENGSRGTDHGAAGLSLLVGTRTIGTMVGEQPALDRLDVNGNLRENVDFRGVYCSLLEQWLGHDAEPLIPGAARLARYRLVA